MTDNTTETRRVEKPFDYIQNLLDVFWQDLDDVITELKNQKQFAMIPPLLEAQKDLCAFDYPRLSELVYMEKTRAEKKATQE